MSIQSAVMLILPSWSAAVPSLTTRQNPNRRVPLMPGCLRCRRVICDMFSVDLNEGGGEGVKARLLNCWVNSGPACFPGAVIGWAAPLSASALFGFGFKSSPPAAYTANTRVVEWWRPFEWRQVPTHLASAGRCRWSSLPVSPPAGLTGSWVRKREQRQRIEAKLAIKKWKITVNRFIKMESSNSKRWKCSFTFFLLAPLFLIVRSMKSCSAWCHKGHDPSMTSGPGSALLHCLGFVPFQTCGRSDQASVSAGKIRCFSEF